MLATSKQSSAIQKRDEGATIREDEVKNTILPWGCGSVAVMVMDMHECCGLFVDIDPKHACTPVCLRATAHERRRLSFLKHITSTPMTAIAQACRLVQTSPDISESE